jgi:glycosyltransferase involved in cell wall biosynthesis
MKKLPEVTFVIPTLNAAEILPRCLSAIRNQKYPQNRVEIIVADGGSMDDTVNIAKSYGAKVIPNPEILHEPGKSRASKAASGEIIFYTDADNVLAQRTWLTNMVKPYMDNPEILGFLPQTIPAQDSNALDRYLGFLFTDPFTWFVYGSAANPKYFGSRYAPIVRKPSYSVYRFPNDDIPLFGLSQGAGTLRTFKRIGPSYSDDITAGINMIKKGGLIAYVPHATVYHYHVSGISNFIRKYTWRVRNNIFQTVKGMGLVYRTSSFSKTRKMRMYFFIPYALSVILPAIDGVMLAFRERDIVMLWHIPATIILACIIVLEYSKTLFLRNEKLPGAYE